MCFAAGVLIAAPFLHMIPKSFAMNPQGPMWLLVGFLGLHSFNRFLTAFVVVMRKELGDWRWMLFAVTLHLVIAVAIASLIYHVSSLLGIES